MILTAFFLCLQLAESEERLGGWRGFWNEWKVPIIAVGAGVIVIGLGLLAYKKADAIGRIISPKAPKP